MQLPWRKLRNRKRLLIAIAAVVGCVFDAPLDLHGGTVVLANRTTQAIAFQLDQGATYKLGSGDVLPISAATSHTIRFAESVRPMYVVDPNAIYFFGPAPPSRVDLVRIGLGGDSTSSSIFESDLVAAAAVSNTPAARAVTTIPVKLLVDDEEAANRTACERRLRSRLQAASEVFERHCFVRFEPVAFELWESDDEILDFEKSLADFESKVQADPARLAVGFTSQYRLELGRTHLGGTRGPLHTHLMVREWSNRISEPERLEVLLHELGHFLGAVHSPEPDSVMRAILGDKRARAASFRIGFDPLNTLALCLVGDSMRGGRVNRFADMDMATQLELHKLYSEISRTDLGDKTPAQYVGLLERSGVELLLSGTRAGVHSISVAAENNARLPESTGKPDELCRETGDALTDLYVRRAASVGSQMPPETGRRAFLLGIGIGLDRTTALYEHRLIAPFRDRIEQEPQRVARLNALGVPTAQGRHELARHFVLAAALTTLCGAESAEQSCLALQLGNSTRPGAFRSDSYLADLAGIVFARRVLDGKLSLEELSRRFTITDHLPAAPEPATSLSATAFAEQFGTVGDARFRKLRSELGERLRRLVTKNQSR